MDENDLVEVYRAQNAPGAHLLKGVLEEAGIQTVIEGELLQGAAGEVPLGWSISPRLLVRRRDVPQAREIIRHREQISQQVRAGDTENGSVCLSCGAPLAEDEEICPECGWSYQSESA